MNDSLSIFLIAYCATRNEKRVKSDIWLKQTEELIQWAENKNFKVLFRTDAEDSVCFEEKTIYINSRNHPETKYYSLLHEAGHIIIASNWQSFEREMPLYAISNDGRKAKSKAYIVSTIAEEIEAWRKGRRLAARLNHFINDSKYDTTITDSVMTYVEWANGKRK